MLEYWHGGRRNIPVGDSIKSPHERRQQWLTHERAIERIQALNGYNDDRDPKCVYFTTDRQLARGWAALHFTHEGGGALYRVKPMPPSSLAADPDYLDVGFSARRALVLEVAEDDVAMDQDEANRAVNRYSVWSDLSPIYDSDGYMLPCPEHRAFGVTAESYRRLGKWFLHPGRVALCDGRIFVI
jgi:hypothetical protein